LLFSETDLIWVAKAVHPKDLLLDYQVVLSLSLSLSQGSDLWKDRDRFKSFAQASLELCKVYIEIYSSTSSHRELRAAEMHLKNIIKQARYLNFDVWEKLTLEHLLRFPFNLIKCRAADILAYVLVYHFCVTLIL
jgi:hypothetical protein